MSEKHKPISDYSPEYLHAYNGDSLYAVSILFILLVTLCVTLRFYARRMGNVAWGLDDSLIIPGAIFCLALCTCALSKSSFSPLKQSWTPQPLTFFPNNSRPLRQSSRLPRSLYRGNAPPETHPPRKIHPRSAFALPQRSPLPQIGNPSHISPDLHPFILSEDLLVAFRIPDCELVHVHGGVFQDVHAAELSLG